MRPVTSAFLDALTSSHQIATLVEVLRDGEVITTLPVTAGSVTLDATAASRGRVDLTAVDDGTSGLVPTTSDSTLAPYGNEMRVYRGVTYPDGTSELVSLGIFRIDSVDVNDTGDQLELRLAGLDRSARVIDARFEEASQINSGTSLTTAIGDQLTAAGITDVLTADTVAHTTPLVILEAGGDRWQTIQQLATAAGMSVYFDGDGLPVARVIPTASDNPVATLTEGQGGVLLQAGRRWSREGAFNRVIATGEKTGDTAPPRGVATDDNALSPTYYYGRFGKVPRFYSSPLLTTSDQCADAAAGILARELGTTQQITFGALVNPALEPGDVVTVTRERTGINEAHVIDSLTIPLQADQSMSGRTRAVQTTT